jgi:Protein of unknown function (DUF1566)
VSSNRVVLTYKGGSYDPTSTYRRYIARLAQGVAADVSGVTQNWDKVLPAAQRFVVLSGFNGQAVRDNETGLVWEQSPATAPPAWSDAVSICSNRATGNRKGWRLPSVHELASLVDPSVAPPGPTLPPGHPFSNVQSTNSYWSASTIAANPTFAWIVFFGNGNVLTNVKVERHHVWCVRGANNADQY